MNPSRWSGGPRSWTGPFVVLLVLSLIHVARLGVLPIRGEESRWALIAQEMLRNGDWIVPRIQGVPFLSRPPLGSWLIAVSATMLGEMSVFAVRLPSALATVGTGLVIYGMARRAGLSQAGAIAGGVGYGTMAHVLQLGGLAETEAVFGFLLSSALFCWYWGYSSGRHPALAMAPAAILAGLATLAKGPQVPVYFLGPIAAFLVLHRDVRALVHPGMLLGLLPYLAIVGTWQWACAMNIGWAASSKVWTGDVALRFQNVSWLAWSRHILVYPLEVFGSAVPWSLWLLPFFSRAISYYSSKVRDLAQFSGVCLLLTFPTCWFVPNARARYFMPMFPFIALLAGIAIEGAWRERDNPRIFTTWRRFARGIMIASIGGAIVLPLLGRLFAPDAYRQSWALCLVVLVVALFTAGAQQATLRTASSTWRLASILGIASLIGLVINGAGMNVNLRMSENLAGSVGRLRDLLPNGEKLVSLGSVHHAFLYQYAEPVEMHHFGDGDARGREEFTYFCFDHVRNAGLPTPSFDWVKLGEISCERYQRTPSRFTVVFGKRLKNDAPRAANATDEDQSVLR